MGSKLYVGGLPYSATESQLTSLFAEHGTVESARVIADKFTGQSRGFGFVEMSTAEEAKAAITALNGSQMDGRSLTVNEAKPMEPRSGGGGGRTSSSASSLASSKSILRTSNPRSDSSARCISSDAKKPPARQSNRLSPARR